MSLTWQSNFGSTECRIFRGKVIAGLLKTSAWKGAGYGELDGDMLRFKTVGFWNMKTELLDIEGNQVLGTIQYDFMKGSASIFLREETYDWKYSSWTRTSWSVKSGEDSAAFSTKSFWGNKGEIINEGIAGGVLLCAMFVHQHFARMAAM